MDSIETQGERLPERPVGAEPIKTQLSARIRPNVEAAPWVIDEIRDLEAAVRHEADCVEAARAEIAALRGSGETGRSGESTIETGGPAFPMQEPQAIHAYAVAAIDGITDPDERDRAYLKARGEAVGGASLRDHFATHCGSLGDEVSMVLAAQLAATQGVEKPTDSKDLMGWHRFWCAVHAAHRYMMADAMLKAREVKP